MFKDILVLSKDESLLEETIRKSSVVDWTRYLCFGKGIVLSCFGVFRSNLRPNFT